MCVLLLREKNKVDGSDESGGNLSDVIPNFFEFVDWESLLIWEILEVLK